MAVGRLRGLSHTALQSALQMAASQGCWARGRGGLDGGREDLMSSRSSRAWLAGWTPASRCIAVRRSAYSQVQMQYKTYMARREMHTGRWTLLYALMPSSPPATSRPRPQTHSQRCLVRPLAVARMICSSSGWASCAAARWWPGGREPPLAAHGCAVFTLTSYLAWNLRQCNTPLHISQPDGRSHHHLDRASSVRSRREGMCAGDVLLNEGRRDHMLFPFPHNRSKYLQEDCPPP